MMDGFKLSAKVNTENVFLVNHSELEGRLDTDYYRPKISALEKKVRQKTNKKLKDFIIRIASGATPSVQEEARFYGTKDNGIPFLRVQNLNVSGELSLDDVKYINQETHNEYLKRSQVSDHDLLVKITGVGRMAIASVAPSDFDGNTNQHMVVIKTGSQEQSRYLANYLNLDIIEALATRRATGATRPALDYLALKSIPVIENIDFSLLKEAEAQKQQKEQQAQALLDGIDGYLLKGLGITLPKQDNRLEKRIFSVPFSEVTGKRLDVFYNSPNHTIKHESLKSTKYNLLKIKDIATALLNGKEFREYSESGFRYLRVSDLDKFDISNHNPRYIELLNFPESIRLSKSDILISRSGSLGLVSVVTDEVLNSVLSSHIFKLSLDTKKVVPDYIEIYLRSSLGQFQFFQKNNGGIIPELNQSALKDISVIVPPLVKQTEIAAHVTQIRAQAKQLQAEAANLLATAKANIESLILGN